MSRKTIEHEARQQFVLTTAKHLFATKGVENTNMEDIAKLANYTRRTLYAYFKSRDEISLMVFINDLNARWAYQKKEIEPFYTGLEKIIAWAESFYSYVKENPYSIKLNIYWDYKGIERQKIKDDVFLRFEKINTELAERLRDIFNLGLKDESLRVDLNIDVTISQFIYSLRAVLNRAVSSSYSFADFNPDEYVKHFLDLFKRGIQNEKR